MLFCRSDCTRGSRYFFFEDRFLSEGARIHEARLGEESRRDARARVTVGAVGPGLTHGGTLDAFVAKVNAAGTALVYAGYIGGSSVDQGYGIAVDGSGNAYVVGTTSSSQQAVPPAFAPLPRDRRAGPDL